MKYGWLRNLISIDLLAMNQRADDIELSLTDPIRIAQQDVNLLWKRAQKSIDDENKYEMEDYCAGLAHALKHWEELAFNYALSTGGEQELLYARGIDWTHSRLGLLAKKLEINEGNKEFP